MSSQNFSKHNAITISLGANLPSSAGKPEFTLIKARPLVEKNICEWICSSLQINEEIQSISSNLQCKWSPLFSTKAIGGPEKQPSFINAVLIAHGDILSSIKPSEKAAINLLKKLLEIEKKFGRDRSENTIRWGPRTLDIDLLNWGNLQIKHKNLTLPHPRLVERDFVIIPLATLLKDNVDQPKQLAPQPGWKE